jgi:hypothetical protein
MTTIAATTSIMNAVVTPTSLDFERWRKKPMSAAISNAVAINSAICLGVTNDTRHGITITKLYNSKVTPNLYVFSL